MKKYYQAFQAKGTNALKLNFDPSLNSQLQGVNGYLCSATLTPLTDARPVSLLKCPLCQSVYQKSAETIGRICDNCSLCKLGEDALGLNNLVEIPQE